MTLSELKKAYQAGRLAKPAYIDAMNENHRLLHDYARYIEGTDIAGIEISGGFGPLAGKIFRVGIMGPLATEAGVAMFLNAFKTVLGK